MANAFKDNARFDRKENSKYQRELMKAYDAEDKRKANRENIEYAIDVENQKTAPDFRVKDKPKKQSFSAAFAAARKAGKDKFTWNGKSYTTDRADDKKEDKPMPTGNIGSRQMFDEGETGPAYKRGGGVKKYAKGGAVGRDGCAQRGKTKGRMV